MASRLSARQQAFKNCVRHWRWWASARHLAVTAVAKIDKSAAQNAEPPLPQGLLAQLASQQLISPYHVLSVWSYVCRNVFLCGDVASAPTAVLLSGSLMRIFTAAGHSSMFHSFMHKFHVDNKTLSIFGWKEAFGDINLEIFHQAVVKAASSWPSSLLTLFLSMLADMR